ncbi:porin [Myroides ceti]|uniref:Porin n=1 Tax=Paenimyroides ceti TaxID=395087 RepID=A0ABT8CT29_9FLAO|nr:porin [Paenimyroides ceti]MDN3706387.1 porin [Paenimyroides ceti]
MKRLLLSSLLLLTSGLLYSQDDIHKSQEFKLAALPYYSYGKGLGMTSADSLFQLNIRFRMQNRVTYFDYEEGESNYEAQIRRLRLRLDGYVGDPRFQYALQLSFAPGDVGAIEEGENLNIIRDAAVSYRANRHWNIIFGQTKIPGNRQRVNSSGSLQLTDRSINNAKFNIDRDFGFQVYYLNELKDKFSWNVKTAITTGNGRNWDGKDTNVALTGKLELLPLGVFTKGGDYFEGDIAREKTPKFMISGVFHQNNDSQYDRGQQGNLLFEQKDLQSTFIDAVFKYNGWAAMYSYMNRMTKKPITYGFDADGKEAMSYVFAGHGMDYQVSYTFPSNYEIIGRVSTQNVHDDLYKIQVPDAKQYSIGLTKYIWEHAFKLQTEFTIDDLNYFDGSHERNWYIRFQIEIGI